MMIDWRKHIDSPFYKATCFVFFFLALFGIFNTLKNKNKKYLPFVVLYFFSLTMLATDVPIFSLITELARKYIPLFATIFRFTFTKFSIIYALSYSIMIGLGIFYLFEYLKNDKIKKILAIIFFIIIIFHSLPAFKGHLFYEDLAVKIPDEYFQVFDFFQKQDKNQRIAILPIPWYWAWVQPKWGTINSGFIWYGIPQPITDLAFTPWGKQNENFYWELEQAIFSNNSFLLRKVLEKYDISWIYLDKNILNNAGKKIDYEVYEDLIKKTGLVKKIFQFNNIKVFKLTGKDLKNFIEIKTNLLNIHPEYNYNNLDQAYLDFGDYLTSKNQEPNVYYPFRSLFSGKLPSDFEHKIIEDSNYLYFLANVPKNNHQYKLVEKRNNYEFKILKQEKALDFDIDLLIENKQLKIKIPKEKTLIYDSKNDPQFINQENNACNKNSEGLAKLNKSNNEFVLTSINSHNCIKVVTSNMLLRNGYLVKVKVKNDNIRGFLVNFINKTTKKSDLETYLENDGKEKTYYFIIPRRGSYELNYEIFFDNISEGKEKVENILKSVEIYQVPYWYLKSLKFIKKDFNPENTKSSKQDLYSFETKKHSYFLYEVKLPKNLKTQDNLIIYLSQSYHSGWKAFQIKNSKLEIKNWIDIYFPFIFGKEIKEHVLVNNWANGWEIDKVLIEETENEKPIQIIIVFLASVLAVFGFWHTCFDIFLHCF
ncbi:MAG: hypothetical protein KatS3mg090_0847 [Patescibacteria group bacterium]|nr:MAG: hypothetical protein KatS3mg090_0847 [Patescibacteria group bacterium]